MSEVVDVLEIPELRRLLREHGVEEEYDRARFVYNKAELEYREIVVNGTKEDRIAFCLDGVCREVLGIFE